MRWILTTAIILGALVIFHPARADAGMHFCNKTDKRVSVAIATVYDRYYAHVWGWWQVEPGGCKTPIGADLDTSLSYYYYASDFSGGTWTDSKMYGFCIDPNYAFDYSNSDDDLCRTGTREHFRYIDIGYSRDYTVNLTD